MITAISFILKDVDLRTPSFAADSLMSIIFVSLSLWLSRVLLVNSSLFTRPYGQLLQNDHNPPKIRNIYKHKFIDNTIYILGRGWRKWLNDVSGNGYWRKWLNDVSGNGYWIGPRGLCGRNGQVRAVSWLIFAYDSYLYFPNVNTFSTQLLPKCVLSPHHTLFQRKHNMLTL